MGCGFIPENMAKPYLNVGTLIHKEVKSPKREIRSGYAWRVKKVGNRVTPNGGLALEWWLNRLEHEPTQRLLLEDY